MNENGTPETLLDVVRHFADERVAWAYFVARRWPNGVICPHCGCTGKIHVIETRLRFRCNDCGEQFSAKTGTVFEASPIPFSKWLPAIWLITNAKNGISSYEIHRGLGVTQKTAWFMLHRIRLAFQNGSFENVVDDVEIDETFIGGKARNMHKHERARKITGTGGKDKTAVFGMLERGGEVRTFVVSDREKATLEPIDLCDTFDHQVTDHAVAYVDGQVHTNGIENFWALLKRCLHGTYVSVEPFHLFRYLDEQVFRYNERKGTDADRFEMVCGMTASKRLTYAELTGK